MKLIPSLDFIERSPARPWGWLLLLVALPLFAWQGSRYISAVELRDEQAVALKKADLASRTPRRTLSDGDVRYVTQASQAATQLAAPWNTMLAMLEEHRSENIALLKLEPNAKTGQLKIVGEARTGRAMVSYLQSLENDTRLSQVTLINHQLQKQTPGEPIRFTAAAQWLAAASNTSAQPDIAPPNTEPPSPKSAASSGVQS